MPAPESEIPEVVRDAAQDAVLALPRHLWSWHIRAIAAAHAKGMADAAEIAERNRVGAGSMREAANMAEFIRDEILARIKDQGNQGTGE